MDNDRTKPTVIPPLLFRTGCLYEARKAVESKSRATSSQPQSAQNSNHASLFETSPSPPSRPLKTKARYADDLTTDSSSKRARTAAPELDHDFSSLLSISEPDYSTMKDSELEELQLNGGTTLPEFDGDINDLIRELERTRAKHERHREGMVACVNKIRELSIILERRCRESSQVPMSTQPSSLDRRNSISASAVSLAKNKKLPIVTRETRSSQSLPPQQYQPMQRAPLPPQSPQPTVKRRQSSASIPSKKLIQRGDCMPIASSNVVATLFNVLTDTRSKAFARKPRNMIMPSSITDSDLGETMVTSAMDGSLQFWDLEKKSVVANIPQSQMHQPWSEDICWVNQNVLAAACAHQAGTPLHHQLALIHAENSTSSKSPLGRGMSYIKWSVQQLKQMPHDGSKGSIMCISSLGKSDRGFSLATAGMDKQVFRWQFESSNLEQECYPTRQQLIHNKHTAMIQAMCYAPETTSLYTGGSDCKIIGWDLRRSALLFEDKGQDRINTIDQNPVDPRLFLVSRASLNNQLSLYDSRQGFHMPALQFGVDGSERLTKQIKPSWHPDGTLVSCGMQSGSKINIWDIRWKEVMRGTGQTLNPHASKNVLKAAFHPTRSLMASMSTDGSLAFT
ncbi:hypothetical protein BGX27_005316, partial [Mortierella sp. AM989]